MNTDHHTKKEFVKAAEIIDWAQIVSCGGPPCFHLESVRFCSRNLRWEGHGVNGIHEYVSLAELLRKMPLP